MHSNHKLGYANSKLAGYYSYYQSLLPHLHKGISNAFWSMPKLSLQIKRNIFHYRTGTLLNQKHVVHFKMSTSLQCPLCRQVAYSEIVLSIFSQGVDIRSSLVWSLKGIMLPAGSL